MEKKTYIKNRIKENLNICIDDDQADKLITFYDLIVEKNKVMNLTAITTFEEFVSKHFVDSLSVCKIIDLNNKKLDIIDIGTGAGFPGVPIKIIYPDLNVTLFDSLQKRLSFLDEVINTLGLINIRTVHGRAEEFGRNLDYREKYDIVVSRAVAELTTLCELSLPFCKKEGHFISYKGSKGNDELDSAKFCIEKLGGVIENTVMFNIMNDNSEDNSFNRYLISIKKINNTDEKYPRGGGKPFKHPLII